jgi:hypothetical protein
VVVMVIAAEDLFVELRPAGAGFGIITTGFEGMAGGADPDDTFSTVDVVSDGVEILLGQGAAADTDDEEVSLLEGSLEAGEVVFVVGVGVDDRGLDAAPIDVAAGEIG